MSEPIKLPPTHRQYELEVTLYELREWFKKSSLLELPALTYTCHDQVRARLEQAQQLIEEAYQEAARTGCLNLPEHKRPPEGFVFGNW